MKKFALKELPDVVAALYGKMEYFETLLKTRVSKHRFSEGAKKYFVRDKCGSQYNKIDLAQLFYILMDENILFFNDKNEKQNRGKMQEFVEENFTYFGVAGRQVAIDTISKQFSESKGFTYREKQLKFLDEIIRTFQKRREKIVVR